jgi:hypothetical protein
MRTCVWLLVGLVAACGDDGGSPALDAKGSDAAGSGSDAGGGLQGSTSFATPTDIEVGQTGNGTLAPINSQTSAPQHFWRFVPPTTGSYTITLSSAVIEMATTWCGNFGSEQGCGCFLSGGPPDPCCKVEAAGVSCTAITEGAMADDDGILIVYNSGDASGSYTITLTAP